MRMPGNPGELSNLESVYAVEVAAIAARTFAVGVEPALLRKYAEEAVVTLVRGGSICMRTAVRKNCSVTWKR